MEHPIGVGAALVASGTLWALAGLHVYWGRGGHWPAKTEAGLVATVVGVAPNQRMPGLGACLVVAALLGIAASLPPMLHWIAPFSSLARIGILSAAAVLGLRGLAGFFDRRLRPAIIGLPYDRLNRRVYSPLCLALAAALAVSVWASPHGL